MRTSSLVFFFAFVAFAAAASPNFLSNAIGSNMVLQRGPAKSRLWGWTSQKAVTTLTWNSKTFTATADQNGLWVLELPATAAGGPHQFTLTSNVGDSVVLSNILFGDVFFCSGQSNMEMTTNYAYNASVEIKNADNYPNVRFFTADHDTSDTPIIQLKKPRQPWSVASSASIAPAGSNDAWNYFSATCWFFGKNVYDNTKVPLGLVASSWGGTIIQAWMAPEALAKCPASVVPLQQHEEITASDMVRDDPNRPSVLWNAMVVPFLYMKVSGFVWYQGESNVGQTNFYKCAFPVMIQDWRKKFPTSNNAPFYFVQISTWIPGGPEYNIPAMRIAQTSALSLPQVGMAVACDLGDIGSPLGNIHPRNKQEVGRRLALNALAFQYGKRVVRQGPTAVNATKMEVNNNAVVSLQLDPSTLLGGITIQPPPSCPNAPFCGAPAEIQKADGTWAQATIAVQGNSVSFSLNGVRGIKAVRYAYSDWPMNTIYNRENLPMPPFLFNL